MQRFRLYPSEVLSVAMNIFTASGSARFACLLRKDSAFRVKFIV